MAWSYFLYTYIQIYMYTCTYIYTYTQEQVHVKIRRATNGMYGRIYGHKHIQISMYACTYTHIYIYTHTKTLAKITGAKLPVQENIRTGPYSPCTHTHTRTP